MRYYVLEHLVLLFVTNLICSAIEISSKLDFDGPKSSSRLIEGINKRKPLVYRNREKENDGTNNKVEIICASTDGCNTTESIKTQSKDSIETDVVVHVKTNVAINNNKTDSFVDDTPDIPVIVGSSDPNHSHNYNQYNHPLTTTERVLSINPVVPVSSVHYSHQPHTPSTLTSTSIYNQRNYPSADHHIKIGSLTFDNTARSGVDNTANNVEIHVPYFESTYHNHYFGENPPPQVVWYSKSATPGYGSKATIKPAFWSGRDLNPTTQKFAGTSSTGCSCKNHVNTGLQWYPARRVYNVDPGRQIDDKLAPLD
ncbi:uncharacterized protein LOC135141473 [Zophobas morio]|uniref:uncharacterized protein LOC135141473 n=1 Tax=Zophobas morio TaxID=2755281 RepID=UPI0030836FBE